MEITARKKRRLPGVCKVRLRWLVNSMDDLLSFGLLTSLDPLLRSWRSSKKRALRCRLPARSPRPRDRIQPQQIIQRDLTWPEWQYRQFHRCPGQVEIHPAVGDGQLDDRRHAEQPQRRVARAEAGHQQAGGGALTH